MDDKQKEFIDLLELGPDFTLKELNVAYFTKAKEFHPDRHNGVDAKYWSDKMIRLNEAYNYLKRKKQNEQKKKKNDIYGDKSAVFTTSCCKKLGLSLETAQQIYKRCSKEDYKLSFDEWLKRRLANLKRYEASQEEVLQLCKQSIMLSQVSFENIINLYECDCEFGSFEAGFSDWLSSLVETCKEIEQKLEKKNYFSIIKEIKDYIYDDLESNFVLYLKAQSKIRELCQELKQDVYDVEYEYDYSDFRGTFTEYLENKVAIRRVINDMGMTKRESDEYYTTYLQAGYKGSKLDFLREAQAVLPFRYILEKSYFSLKKRYANIPEEERPESFVFWVELQAVLKTLQCSPTQILEKIYINTKESGYTNTFKDLIISLAGPHLTIPNNDDEFSNEAEEEQEVKHNKSV